MTTYREMERNGNSYYLFQDSFVKFIWRTSNRLRETPFRFSVSLCFNSYFTAY